MLPLITRNIIYPILQHFRAENVYQHLRELEESQRLGQDELKKRQWCILKELLQIVYKNNAYYRKRLEAEGIKPQEIKTYDDFLKIPLLEKEDLRRDAKLMISDLKNGPIESRKTSGSTGIPLEILKDRNSTGRIRAIFHRYYKWYGIGIGDRQARFMGHPVTFGARFKENIQDFLLNKYRLDPVFLTPKNMMSFYRQIKKAGRVYFYGYPSAIYEFGKFLEGSSLNPYQLGVRVIITTGETLYDFQRKFIERVFKARVVNEYGCSETGIIAFECPQGKMHLSEDNLFIEVLKDGQPAKPGETGEIVITELFNYSLPLIRYRVGDLAKASFEPICSCGRGLSCIDSIEGRTSEFINLPYGRKVHSEVFHYIADGLTKADGVIKQFRIIQNNNWEFSVEYASANGDVDKSLEYLSSQLHKFLGDNIRLNFRRAGNISRDRSGKLRYFVSELI